MTEKLNALAFGISAAIVAALSMLLLGILGNIGVYKGAVEMMSQWHMFFSLTPGQGYASFCSTIGITNNTR